MTKQSMTTMQLAFSRAGVRMKRTVARWPRLRGPKGLRVEIGTGYLVAVVR